MDENDDLQWFDDHTLSADVDDVRPRQERVDDVDRVDELRWAGIVFELTEGPPFG